VDYPIAESLGPKSGGVVFFCELLEDRDCRALNPGGMGEAVAALADVDRSQLSASVCSGAASAVMSRRFSKTPVARSK
jgi:hypothetical protein